MNIYFDGDKNRLLCLCCLSFLNKEMESYMKDPEKFLLKYGLAAVLAIELYKFIKFIAS